MATVVEEATRLCGVSARRAKRMAGTLENWHSLTMRPVDIQQIGEELAIKWDDGTESFIPLEKLRRYCPCAGCKGERDIMGNLYKNPDKPLTPTAFKLRRIDHIGTYALQPVWADGHATGLFSYDYLRQVADSDE